MRYEDNQLIVWNVQNSFGSCSVLVWGEISHLGKTEIVIIHGAMTAHRYCNEITLRCVLFFPPTTQGDGSISTWQLKSSHRHLNFSSVARTRKFEHSLFACIKSRPQALSSIWGTRKGKQLLRTDRWPMLMMNRALLSPNVGMNYPGKIRWTDDVRRYWMQKVVTLYIDIDGYLIEPNCKTMNISHD